MNSWYNEESKFCMLCNVEESIEHYFKQCIFVADFWKMFFQWWTEKSNCILNLGTIDIIFGVMNEINDCVIGVLNYCILFAKRYINSCRLNNKRCNFENYLEKLNKRIFIEMYISEINGMLEAFNKKWYFVLP